MSNRFFKFILTTGILFSAGITKAQFNISGEFRSRGEYRDGYLFLRDSSRSPNLDIIGRARLAFDYSYEKFSTRFSIQQAFTYGQNYYSSDTISKNTVNLFEAWFKYNFNGSFGLKLGRTEVVYDDERLFGASNWSMWGATHDILIAQWDPTDHKIKGDFGFAVNNIAPASPFLNSYNMRNNYKYLSYLYLNKKLLKNKLNVSVLAAVDAFQKYGLTITKIKNDTQYIYNEYDSIIGYLPVITKTTSLQEFPDILYARATVGAGLWLNLKKWSFMLNAYYQGGHVRDGRKLNANFYAFWVGYQVVKPLKLMAGYEHLSGNNFSDTTLMKTQVSGFSTLYGTSHRAYGYMDMFTSVVKDNMGMGLNDLFGRVTLSFSDKMSLEASCRWFSLPYAYLRVNNPKKGALPYQEVKKSLGTEMDLMYIYKPVPNLELNAAYCFFLPTATMEAYNDLKPGTAKFAQYAYLMITYKPNFFSSAKN